MGYDPMSDLVLGSYLNLQEERAKRISRKAKVDEIGGVATDGIQSDKQERDMQAKDGLNTFKAKVLFEQFRA